VRLLGEIRYHENSFVDALRLFDDALGEDDQPEFVVPVTLALAYARFSAGDLPTALALARDALGRAERLGDSALLAEALGLVAAGELFAGDWAGWDKLERAVTLEDPNRPIPIQLRPSVIAAELTGYAGRLREAAARLDELRVWFVERGEDSDLPYLLFYVAWVEWLRADYRAALDAADEAVTLAEQAGSDTMLGVALAHRAKAHAARGEIEAARADIDRARVVLEPTGWAVGVWMLTSTIAFLELSIGDLDAAGQTLAPAIGVLEGNAVSWAMAAAVLSDAVETLVGLGQLDRADGLLAPFEKWFEELDLTWLIAAAARCRSLILAARGDLEGALAAAQNALTRGDRLEMPLELARTLLATGQVQRRAKRRGAARASLERALGVCEQIGAPLWADKARAELGRLGAHTTPGQLTATERRVAAGAAEGMTNREIAAQLFLSRRTVEANLARAYQKLGIRSRDQLTAALAARSDA